MNIIYAILIATVLLVICFILLMILEKFDTLADNYNLNRIIMYIIIALAVSLFAFVIISKIIPTAYTDYTVLKTTKLYEESNKIYYEDPDTKAIKFIDLSDETVKFTTEESHVEFINAKWLIFTENHRVIYIHKD